MNPSNAGQLYLIELVIIDNSITVSVYIHLNLPIISFCYLGPSIGEKDGHKRSAQVEPDLATAAFIGSSFVYLLPEPDALCPMYRSIYCPSNPVYGGLGYKTDGYQRRQRWMDGWIGKNVTDGPLSRQSAEPVDNTNNTIINSQCT